MPIRSRILALAFVAAILPGCRVSAGSRLPPPPAGTVRPLTAVQAGDEGRALLATLTDYLRGRHGVGGASFYEVDGAVPWNAVSKFVANAMANQGLRPAHLPEHEPGIDLIDLYEGGKVPFAVVMAPRPNPAGRRLVAYAELR